MFFFILITSLAAHASNPPMEECDLHGRTLKMSSYTQITCARGPMSLRDAVIVTNGHRLDILAAEDIEVGGLEIRADSAQEEGDIKVTGAISFTALSMHGSFSVDNSAPDADLGGDATFVMSGGCPDAVVKLGPGAKVVTDISGISLPVRGPLNKIDCL